MQQIGNPKISHANRINSPKTRPPYPSSLKVALIVITRSIQEIRNPIENRSGYIYFFAFFMNPTAFLILLYHSFWCFSRLEGEGFNEIAQGAMKSSLRSDEIFGMPPQMKLNPPPSPAARQISSRSDFIHRRWISPAEGGFS